MYKNIALSKHKKLILISVAVIVLLPLIAITSVLTLAGVTPGLSTLFSTNQPRDLGIEYTKYDNLTKELPLIAYYKYEDAPRSNDGYTEYLTNPEVVSGALLTDAELTAKLNNLLVSMEWLPLEQIQAKVSDDFVEMSGLIKHDKLNEFENYLRERDAYTDSVKNALAWTRRTNGNVALYIKADVSITNNLLSYQIFDLEIGRLSVPLGTIDSSLVGSRSVHINTDSIEIDKMKTSEGSFYIEGVLPTNIYVL